MLCIAKYRSERIRVLFTEIRDNGIRFHFPFIPYLLFKWSHISNRLKQILNNVQTVHANNLFIKCKCVWKRGINFFLKISYTKSAVKCWKCVNMVKVACTCQQCTRCLNAKPWLERKSESKSNLGFRYTSCSWPQPALATPLSSELNLLCLFLLIGMAWQSCYDRELVGQHVGMNILKGHACSEGRGKAKKEGDLGF